MDLSVFAQKETFCRKYTHTHHWPFGWLHSIEAHSSLISPLPTICVPFYRAKVFWPFSVRSLSLSGLFVLAWESLRFVYASRSSLASKFIVALWAFCVYYYCGSRIHSVPFSFFSFVLFISSVLSLSLSRRVVLVSFIFGYCVCVCLQFRSYLIRIHLQNVCFVFSHVINFNLAKNRKQRSKWWCCHWCCCCNNHTFRVPSFAHIVIWS